MQRILLTGCAGFVGSHLGEKLLQEGYDVIGIDNYMPNYDRKRKERNRNYLFHHPRFTWINGDLGKVDVSSIVQQCDVIFHQAALPGVRASWGSDFEQYTTHNIVATQRLLEAAKASNVQKFIYASSSSVYGMTSGTVSEKRLPAPYSPYGVSKLAAEHLCQLYYTNYGVPTVSLRYFTVYGPRQRPDMAFQLFIERALRGKAITIYGDGHQTRDFTYVADAVRANMLAMKNGKAGEVYNIGGGNTVSLRDVIDELTRQIGVSITVKYTDNQPGDVRHTAANIYKARTELGYDPAFPLDKGLAEQIQYAKLLDISQRT